MTGVWVFLSFVILHGLVCARDINRDSEEMRVLRSVLRELKREQSQNGPDGTPVSPGYDDGSDNNGGPDDDEPDDNEPDDNEGPYDTQGPVYRDYNSPPGDTGNPVPPDDSTDDNNMPDDDNVNDNDDDDNDNDNDDDDNGNDDDGDDNDDDNNTPDYSQDQSPSPAYRSISQGNQVPPDDNTYGDNGPDDNDDETDDNDGSYNNGPDNTQGSTSPQGTSQEGALPFYAFRDFKELQETNGLFHTRRGRKGPSNKSGRGKGPKPDDGSLLGRTCPILKEILPAYFKQFPWGDFTDKIDYSNIVNETKSFIEYVFRMNRLMRNTKVVAEDSTLMLAAHILDRRVQCPATKLQQAMLYVVDKLLASQFKMEDGTLKMNLSRILANVQFRSDAEREGLLSGIVWGLHHVLFREFNDEFAIKEFLPLEKFLRRFRMTLPKFLKMQNDGETKLFRVMMQMKTKQARVFMCTPPERIFKIHTAAMQRFQKRFQEEQALGVVTTEAQVIFDEIFDFLPETKRKIVVGQLLYVLKNYVVDLIDKAMTYESFLATKVFNHDVHGFVLDVLSSEQVNYLQKLLQHLGFSGLTPPTSIPSVMPVTDMPSNMPPTDMPSNMPPTDMPSNMPPTDMPSNMPPTDMPSNMPPTDMPSNMPPTDMPSAMPSTVLTEQPNTVPPPSTYQPFTETPTNNPPPSRRFFKNYEFLNRENNFASGDMDLRSDFASGDMALRSDFASDDNYEFDLRSALPSADGELIDDETRQP